VLSSQGCRTAVYLLWRIQVFRRVACLGSLLLSSAVSAQGREPQTSVITAKYSVPCKSCRVEFEKVVTIGDTSVGSSLSQFAMILRDTRGRFFTRGDAGQLLVFDNAGRRLAAIGRTGSGPGEFAPTIPPGRLNFSLGRGDSIFVWNGNNAIVIAPNLVVARTWDVPNHNFRTVASLSDGFWLVSGHFRDSSRIGRSFHVMTSNGSFIRAIGPEHAVGPGHPILPVPEFMVTPAKNSFWYRDKDGQFSFTRWSAAGEMMQRIELTDVPWLPTPSYVARGGKSTVVMVPEGAGSATLAGIDTAGNLWVTIRPPRDGASRESTRGGRAAAPVEMRLDVVNPRTGEVLSSQPAPIARALFPSGDLAFSAERDQNGFLSFTVWTFRYVSR